MGVRLSLLQRFFPTPLKLWMLQELARATADGFGIQVPEELLHGAFKTRLVAYAEFTAREARRVVDEGGPAVAAAKKRLRRSTAGLGTAVRRRLGLRKPTEAFDAWKLLYGQLGIEVGGGPRGQVTITRCFFADFYDESVCGVVEALDDGLANGLFDGASLIFAERLTGGRPCCRAILRLDARSGGEHETGEEDQ
jgi:hypothetical protein